MIATPTLELRWYDYYDPANETITRQDNALWNSCLAEVGGTSTFQATYEEEMAAGSPVATGTRPHNLVALEGETVVAYGALYQQLNDNVHEANVNVGVTPERRRQGLGTRMLAMLTDRAHELGVTRLSAWPLTEAGRVPLGELFGLAHGFAPHDDTRVLELALPVPPARLAELGAEAEAGLGGAFRVEVAVATLPEEWLEDLAFLHRRMSTDVPHTVEREEAATTPQTLRERYAAWERGGAWWAIAVARDLRTGSLVAYTVLTVQPGQDRALQGDTLVIREHRGHRLGLAIKLAALGALQGERPDVVTVVTGNDATNAPMLAVNERLGFVDTARLSNWTREI